VDRQRVRRVISRFSDEGKLISRYDGSEHVVFPVATSVAEGEALRALVADEGARHSIEIGLGYGVSTLFICDGLMNGEVGSPRHLAIDPYQGSRLANVGLELLEEAGVSAIVDHYGEESQVVLPRLLCAGRRFDFAFVDGNHRFDWLFVDLFFLGRLLLPGSVVFLDDYQLPAVSRATNFFVRNLGWTMENRSDVDPLHSWAVLRTGTRTDDRHFEHFVDF